MKALLSHHSCVSPWWVYKGKGKNWIVTVQRNIPFIEIFGAQWEVGGRDDRKNKKMLKGWDNLLVPVFYNISALVPVELNLENCIYITELGGCSHTSVLPPSSIYRVPCLAPGTPQSRETLCTHPGEAAQWEPFPPLQDYSVWYLNYSPHLLEVKGREDLSDCICDPGNSSQAETAESLIFRKIT